MVEKRSRRRQVIERRLEEITLLAENIIMRVGINGLTLQEVISNCSISRGTFYKQFPNKETLITYLGIKGINFWSGLLEKAADYDALSREKFLVLYATHVLCHKLKPINYQCIFIANSEVNRLAVSSELNMILDDRISNLIRFIEDCIQLGIKEGNLKIPDHLTTSELAFFMWANRYGATVASYNFHSAQDVDLTQKFKQYSNYCLDNMQWKPLSEEINYERVLNSIFNTYYKRERSVAKKMHPQYQPFSITQEAFE